MHYLDLEENANPRSLKNLQVHQTKEDTEVKVLFEREERGDEEKKCFEDFSRIYPFVLIDKLGISLFTTHH